MTCSVNEGKSNKSHQGQKDKSTNIFWIHSSLTYRISPNFKLEIAWLGTISWIETIFRSILESRIWTETEFDIVLMAPHDTKQACRKRVKIKSFIDQ